MNDSLMTFILCCFIKGSQNRAKVEGNRKQKEEDWRRRLKMRKKGSWK